jgi:hypothetical protein
MVIQNDGIPVGALATNSFNDGIPAPQPLYQGLSATSTPAQIAAAYSQFTSGSGGDTTANQDIARSYLTNLGISAPTIEQAYNQFTQPASVAQTVANTSGIGSLGIGTNVDYGGSNVLAGAGAPTNVANNNVLGGLIIAGDSFLSNPANTAIISSQTGQNVTNVARGGSTTTDVINQLDGFINSGGTFAPGSTIMLNLGGNDLLQGANPATVEKNLNQLISTLGNLGVKVILSGASDVGSVADVTGSTNLAMSNIYNNVAANNPNVTLVDAMSGLLNQKNLVDETGFHLTAPGQTAFNAALSNAYLNSTGKGNISYSDQAIKDFAEANNLSLTEALALAPSFGVSADRVRSALGGDVQKLYQEILGREADTEGLDYWRNQFGFEISPEERAQFEASAKTELDKRVQGLYTDFLGRDADAAGMDYWRNQFGSTIDDNEREIFRQSAAAELNKQFGVTGGTAAPTTEGILSGFKYANDSGISEDKLKKTLGEDVFNTYKTGFADYAKTGIANVLADKQLSFDEARDQVKFSRDYGYDAQELADLTGTKKEVFDAIFKNYDDTTNKIVDTVLGAEDVKTNGDRIQRALALQKEYGFTDEDLAKATDFSLEQVKGFLDPVRNYESDYKKLVEDPDLNEDKTRAFLTTALQNPFLKEKLGDKLQPALDELNRPPRERILDQIGRQRDVLGAQRYRGVFGDPEVMADVLERKGVKSLADLGRKDKYEATPAEKRYFAPDGTPVEDLGNGTFGVMGSEGGYGPTFSKSQVQTVYGRTESTMNPDGESSTSRFIEIPKNEIDKDGNYQQRVGTVVVNKRTGEELTGTDHKLAVQSSSGGLRKKSNSLNVGFDKNGNAVLMASSERAGLGGLVQDLAPMISMALPFVLPGLGAGLSSMLPGAGAAATATSAAVAPTLMNQALTQGIISGGLTTLGGGQFEKGFLGGAVNPFINAGINSLLPTGLSENATNAIRGAGTNVLRGVLQGESFGDLLGQGVLSGLTNYGLNAAIGSSGLTPQQLNFATGIALPLLQGQKVSPINLMTTLASASQQQPKGRTP